MPLPGRSPRCSASQPSCWSEAGQPQHAEAQALALERAAQHEHVVRRAVGADRQLLGDVVDDALVGGGGRRQHRDVGAQPRQRLADAPVVGPEVVAPVGDAVGLVDDEQPDALGERRQQAVAEVRVVEPLRADQQHVDRAVAQRRLDGLPLLGVRRVDGVGGDAGARRGLDLVAHQRQQRRHDQRRTGALGPQQPGGHEVDRRLPPARCAARRAPAAARRRAPRSPPTGRRAAPRRRARRAPAGSSRRRVSWSVDRTEGVSRSRPERPGPIAGTHSARTSSRRFARLCSLVPREATTYGVAECVPQWVLAAPGGVCVHTAFTIGT